MLFQIRVNAFKLNLISSAHLCPVRHFAVPHHGQAAVQVASGTYPDRLCRVAARILAAWLAENCLLPAANLCRSHPDMAADFAAAICCLSAVQCIAACPAVSCLRRPGFASAIALVMQVSSGCGSCTLSVQEESLVTVSHILHVKGAVHCFMMLLWNNAPVYQC